MNEDELWDSLLGVYLYESGQPSLGISDAMVRAAVKKAMRSMNDVDERRFLTVNARRQWMSDDAIKDGYGIEDAAVFYAWYSDYLFASR